MTAQVSIIMGSDSDLPIMSKATETLQAFEVPFEIQVVSAHRTPEEMVEFAKAAAGRGIQVIIAGAGGAAHLPGMVAACTPLPVIGVPVNITALHGQDALMSIVQMPKGVPVATVGIDNSVNAALLAVRILSLSNDSLKKRLQEHSERQKQKVVTANKNLSQK